jgi:transcriptional regulator with XRE-family HTH domain
MEHKIVEELARIRKEKNISQQEIANRIGCKREVISRMETTASNPTLKTLCAVAWYLGVEIMVVETVT